MSENPANLTPMAIENPPPVAPSLTPEEMAVLRGAMRKDIEGTAAITAGVMGAIGGAIIGGIWALATKGRSLSKIAGVTGIGAIGGYIAGRFGFSKDDLTRMGNEAVAETSQIAAQAYADAPDQRMSEFAKLRAGLTQQDLASPSTQIQASSVQLGSVLPAGQHKDQGVDLRKMLSHGHGRLHNAMGETHTERLEREQAFEQRMHSL